MASKILYVDMDSVLVNFQSGINRLPASGRSEVASEADPAFDEGPGIFALMAPMPYAIEDFTELARVFDNYILSTAPWGNTSAWSDKVDWVKGHFGDDESSPAYKRRILSHPKNLNIGDFVVDNRTKQGVDRFVGEHVHFGTVRFPDWPTGPDYLMTRTS